MPDRPVRHVVTLVSPDGRFGGPTKVALDLCAEQRRRGIDAQLFAGAAGFGALPSEDDGVPMHLVRTRTLVPRLGFAATIAPGLRRAVFDGLTGREVFHVHLARDLVTLPIAVELRRRGLPYVIQTHGMIDASSRSLAHVVDSVLTKRAVTGASRALVLTAEEEAEIDRLSGGATMSTVLENGVRPEVGAPSERPRGGALFLGRLHPRKGATVFAHAAARLAGDHPDGTFRIAGPDEGDLGNVEKVLDAARVRSSVEVIGPVAPAQVGQVMRSASVFVQPAEHEPFGMTVIEAMSVGTPPIVHASSPLAATIVAAGAGWTFDTADDLTRLLEELLSDHERTTRSGERARGLAADRYSLTAVVDRLQDLYPDAV